MEARELRIGNIIEMTYLPNGKVFISINSYQINQLNDKEKGCRVAEYYDSFRPIPITEEWLIKFGGNCVMVEGCPIYYVNPFDIEYYENESVLIIGNSSVKLKYVHQLQNLYFALTGEEITLINQ